MIRRLVLATMLVLAGCQGGNGVAPAIENPEFVGEASSDGALVFLRGRRGASDGAEGDTLVVDVVARGAPEVNGAALRILFDPAALRFVEAAPSSVWPRVLTAVAKEGTPGQLAIAWGARGAVSIEAKDETLLGTLTFVRISRAESTLRFKTERSSLVDRRGLPVEIAFRGGTVTRRY